MKFEVLLFYIYILFIRHFQQSIAVEILDGSRTLKVRKHVSSASVLPARYRQYFTPSFVFIGEFDSEQIFVIRCSGSIIAKTLILTAAECQPQGSVEKLTVIAGLSDLNDFANPTDGKLQKRKILEWFNQPDYDERKRERHESLVYYNVAIAQLSDELAFNKFVHSAKLPDNDHVVDVLARTYDECMYVGLPDKAMPNGSGMGTKLQVIRIPQFDIPKRRYPPNETSINNTKLAEILLKKEGKPGYMRDKFLTRLPNMEKRQQKIKFKKVKNKIKRETNQSEQITSDYLDKLDLKTIIKEELETTSRQFERVTESGQRITEADQLVNVDTNLAEDKSQIETTSPEYNNKTTGLTSASTNEPAVPESFKDIATETMSSIENANELQNRKASGSIYLSTSEATEQLQTEQKSSTVIVSNYNKSTKEVEISVDEKNGEKESKKEDDKKSEQRWNNKDQVKLKESVEDELINKVTKPENVYDDKYKEKYPKDIDSQYDENDKVENKFREKQGTYEKELSLNKFRDLTSRNEGDGIDEEEEPKDEEKDTDSYDVIENQYSHGGRNVDSIKKKYVESDKKINDRMRNRKYDADSKKRVSKPRKQGKDVQQKLFPIVGKKISRTEYEKMKSKQRRPSSRREYLSRHKSDTSRTSKKKPMEESFDDLGTESELEEYADKDEMSSTGDDEYLGGEFEEHVEKVENSRRPLKSQYKKHETFVDRYNKDSFDHSDFDDQKKSQSPLFHGTQDLDLSYEELISQIKQENEMPYEAQQMPNSVKDPTSKTRSSLVTDRVVQMCSSVIGAPLFCKDEQGVTRQYGLVVTRAIEDAPLCDEKYDYFIRTDAHSDWITSMIPSLTREPDKSITPEPLPVNLSDNSTKMESMKVVVKQTEEEDSARTVTRSAAVFSRPPNMYIFINVCSLIVMHFCLNLGFIYFVHNKNQLYMYFLIFLIEKKYD